MRKRTLLVACALAAPLLVLGSAPAAAGGRCCQCGTFYGLGYVPYYHYYPRTNYYQPCCGGSCHRRRACAGRGWDWHAWHAW